MKFVFGFFLGWLSGILMLASTVGAFFAGFGLASKFADDKTEEKAEKPENMGQVSYHRPPYNRPPETKEEPAA